MFYIDKPRKQSVATIGHFGHANKESTPFLSKSLM